MAEKQVETVEIEVLVDNHTHAGEPVAKGAKIKVTPDVAKMLAAAWAKEADK